MTEDSSPAESSADQRWGARIPLNSLATVRVGDLDRLAKVRDISISGCFLETQFSYGVGATLNLRFALEPLDPKDQQIITVDGKVTAQGKNGIGIRFIYGNTETPLRVKRWIAASRPISK